MRKMKVLATALLLIALIGAVISWPFRQSFFGGLALAAFEAALVGALADWFAIVAIFRHPLGLKFIPHTAIIPSNRERIINTISDIVEKQWLSIEIIQTKIKAFPFVDKICMALESDEGKQRLGALVTSILSNTVKNVEPEDAAQFIHRMIKENFSQVSLPEELIEKFEDSLKELYGDDVIDFLIDKLTVIAVDGDFTRVLKNTLDKAAKDYSMKGGFLRRLGKGLGESLDVINYGEAADSLSKKFAEFLKGIKDENNLYRKKLKTAIRDIRFVDKDAGSYLIGNLIGKIINTDDGMRVTIDLVKELKEQLIAGDIEKSPLVKYFSDIILAQAISLKSDEPKKSELEAWIKGGAIGLVDKYHKLIGNLVKENLQSLNDESFAESLEEKVGEDLQWIRVNGTVIGAIIGIVEYLILHLM